MGNRMHVHIRHEIKYGAEGFNWEMDGVKKLLEDAGCCISGELNEDSIGDWEIDENEFKKAVRKIKGMAVKRITGYFNDDYVGKDHNEFKKYITDLLQEFVDTGDHRNGYYHFSWF